jgi:RimJ/RimL family protein N-acetyltransferase
MTFVPEDFDPPVRFDAGPFRLVPLDPAHNDADLAAWSADIDHVRRTPGFPSHGWPPPEGMAPERNRDDLARHRDDFRDRRGFTYTVLAAAGGEVIGCVYLYPCADGHHDAEVRTWVRGADAELDGPLHDAVTAWLATAWPFRSVHHPGRDLRR